jgi:hypothetical protein
MRVPERERPRLHLQLPINIQNNRSEDCYQVQNREENSRCIIIDLNADEENGFIVSPFFLDLTIDDGEN